MTSVTPILQVEDLRVTFGDVKAVNGVSIEIGAGELVGIVGESGSGKSTLARSMLDLLPGQPGSVRFKRFVVDGREMHSGDLKTLRGTTFAMIFQDPLSYLNPIMTIGRQIGEAVRRHDPSVDTRKRVLELLEFVRLPAARYNSYPHELSGGMRQRVLIAIALGCRPKMLIADEPTTALDVTTQLEILELLRDLSRDLGMALMLISHDLGVIATLCQRLYIMRSGTVVESGALSEVFSRPQHAYTRLLLDADRAMTDQRGRFVSLGGEA
jgi:ABC-type dipeptide/oligopeptide/nickel transport system ATPase component